MYVNPLYTNISSTADGLQALANGKIDGVFAGAALANYHINAGLCSLVMTADQVCLCADLMTLSYLPSVT